VVTVDIEVIALSLSFSFSWLYTYWYCGRFFVLGNNPSLKKIIETSDKQFAVKVAGVTAEEFFVFKKIFKKQLDEENEEDSDEPEYYSDDN